MPSFGIAIFISVVLCVVALGAGEAWVELFAHGQMKGFANITQAVGIAAGILGQAVLAWIVSFSLR